MVSNLRRHMVPLPTAKPAGLFIHVSFKGGERGSVLRWGLDEWAPRLTPQEDTEGWRSAVWKLRYLSAWRLPGVRDSNRWRSSMKG